MVRDALRNIGYSTASVSLGLFVADSYAYTYEMNNSAGRKVADFATVPSELMSAFQLIPYQSAEDAVFKALGVD